MKDWKSYLQPAATVLVAVGLGLIAIDQYRVSNARFNCAHVFSHSEGAEKALARLGLPKDGNYNNVRGYCRAFVNPANSGGSSIPDDITVYIEGGNISVDGTVDARVGGSLSADVTGTVGTF
jgi:hypothetical protein|tara:strand:- start:148 stop:513 length:366 start_codon:yes stop_codon:yes gene_type:complete